MNPAKKILFFLSITLLSLFTCCQKQPADPENQPDQDTLKVKYPDIIFGLKTHILENCYVSTASFDKEGKAWICLSCRDSTQGTSGDTLLYDSVLNAVLIRNLAVRDIEIDDAGNVWMGTTYTGLYKYNGKKWTNYNASNSPLQARISHMAFDSNGRLWINAGTSQTGGFYSFDGTDNWESYTCENTELPSSLTQGMAYDDSSNTVWVSLSTFVHNCYICSVKDHTLTIYDKEDFGFEPYFMGEIAFGKTKELFVVNDYSLSSNWPNPTPYVFKFDGAHWKACDLIDPELKEPLYCTILRPDRQGDIWGAFIYYDKYRIAVYNGNKWIVNTDMDPIPRMVTDILQDPGGNIWVCTSAGIYILEKNTLTDSM
jgi:ligand-binding sensor domain-containing protein